MVVWTASANNLRLGLEVAVDRGPHRAQCSPRVLCEPDDVLRPWGAAASDQ